MPLGLIEDIARGLNKWFKGKGKRVLLALFGEPLLHPNIVSYISKIRENYPLAQISLLTNSDPIRTQGNILNVEKTRELFLNGLNMLSVDLYDGKQQGECFTYQIKKELPEINLLSYYGAKNHGNTFYYKSPKRRDIILVDSIEESQGKSQTRTLCNHGGYAPPFFALERERRKKCTIPFRELSIRFDGTIDLCCNDVGRGFIVGKYPEESLREIWYSKGYEAIRYFLFNRERIFYPCYRCNYAGGFRKGLIPKPEGKYTLDDLRATYNKYKKLREEVDDEKLFCPLPTKRQSSLKEFK
jgi:hypothetical protein